MAKNKNKSLSGPKAKAKKGKISLTKRSKSVSTQSPTIRNIDESRVTDHEVNRIHDNDEKWSKSKRKKMRSLMAKQQLRDKPNSKNEQKQSNKKKPRKSSPSSKPTTNRKGRSVDETKEPTRYGGHHKPTKRTNAIAVHDGENEKISSKEGVRKLSELQKSFLDRLSGSRFRSLNEELYTKPSDESFERFKSNPELFTQYHEGFRNQVRQWPLNPVDVMLKWIVDHAAERKGSNNKNEKLVVADFGCGDAKLAEKLLSSANRSPSSTEKAGEVVGEPEFEVHSFDLVSGGNDLVTACDMANVPLSNSCVDVAVFSLALMGTNAADFVREAHRVLRRDGVLKIAEVRSRFESTSSSSSSGGGASSNSDRGGKRKRKRADKVVVDESHLNEFINTMSGLGFKCSKIDRSNTMFVFIDFVKNKKAPKSDLKLTLRPCIYKRR